MRRHWRFRESDDAVAVATKKAMATEAPSASAPTWAAGRAPEGYATLDDYCGSCGIRLKPGQRPVVTNVLARLTAGTSGKPIRLPDASRGHILAYPIAVLERWRLSRST